MSIPRPFIQVNTTNSQRPTSATTAMGVGHGRSEVLTVGHLNSVDFFPRRHQDYHATCGKLDDSSASNFSTRSITASTSSTGSTSKAGKSAKEEIDLTTDLQVSLLENACLSLPKQSEDPEAEPEECEVDMLAVFTANERVV